MMYGREEILWFVDFPKGIVHGFSFRNNYMKFSNALVEARFMSKNDLHEILRRIKRSVVWG